MDGVFYRIKKGTILMKGYIAIHRKIKSHWLYKKDGFTNKTFSKFEAWIDLLLSANHENSTIPIGSTVYRLKRGEQIRSLKTLSIEWNWSINKVKRFLELLKNDNMIEYTSDTQTTRITIINYNTYQKERKSNGKQKEIKRKTNGKQTETENNVNNVKKEEAPSFLEKFLADFPQVKPEYQLRGKGEVEINTTKAMILKICELNGAGPDEARWYYNKLDDDGYFNRKGFPMKVNEMVEDLIDLFRRKWVKKMSEREFRELNG
jgi:DNA-binding transcriptional regulator YhcF (GntR family)